MLNTLSFSLGLQSMGWDHTHSGWVCLPSLTQSRNAFIDIPRGLFHGDSRLSQVGNLDYLSSPQNSFIHSRQTQMDNDSFWVVFKVSYHPKGQRGSL